MDGRDTYRPKLWNVCVDCGQVGTDHDWTSLRQWEGILHKRPHKKMYFFWKKHKSFLKIYRYSILDSLLERSTKVFSKYSLLYLKLCFRSPILDTPLEMLLLSAITWHSCQIALDAISTSIFEEKKRAMSSNKKRENIENKIVLID
jgi:hypothetical protein